MLIAAAIGRFLIRLRWPLAVLYALVVLALFGAAVWDGDYWGMLAIAIGLVAQALFCFARGDPRLLRPVTFHRSWALAGIAGGLAALLTCGIITAGSELLRIKGQSDAMLTLIFFATWLIWGVLFTLLVLGRERLGALRRLVLLLIGGSLLQLTATVTAHMLVLRRGGCLVGLATGIGVACGASVLIWAFGPAIVLLFFYEARKRIRGHCPGCGYDIRGLPELRCPECGRPFTPHQVGLTAEELQKPVEASSASP